jgi:oxygen-independent coproporphyrinogen-3 oxidase
MDDQVKKRISPSTVPKKLLDKYFKSGPRYTSYPTAPQFKTEFEEDEIKSQWIGTNDPKGKGLSLYIHIPFCKKRCLYCGCYTEAGARQETAKNYAGALLKEAERVLRIIDPDRPLDQLAMGGGTPVFLEQENMAKLLKGLKSLFNFSPDGERSLEIDPRSIDESYLDLLVDEGFNRFSFGVQDLDPQVQKNVGRIMSEEKIAGLLSHLKAKGHKAINIDLIYGLPGQTPDSFGATIKKIIEFKPSRIALFGYAHVPWMSPHQKALEKYDIPNPEERMALFGLAYDLLLEAGYEHVGMDHFALPEDELIQALKSRTLTRRSR